MRKMAEVGDVANIAEFFASDLSPLCQGQHLLVNGGATKIEFQRSIAFSI